MMAMSLSPRHSTERDEYGTFDPLPSTPVRQPSRSSRSLHGIGIVIVVIVTASYMVTQYQPAGMSTASHTSSAAPDYEQSFLDHVQTDTLREFLHAYASVPHVAGTEQDYKTALYTAQQFEKYGIKAEIKEYYPLLSVPKHRRVTIVAPVVQELNLTEGRVDGDACTSDSTALPPFLAYAASGNVTASIVYVNYATLADFAWLQAQGVDLKGKIALIRYGGNDRGMKVMLAEQHGVAGALIYSDPKDDGFGQGKTYPDGPWRPPQSFQRGSIQYNSVYAGDPLTPGFASTIDAPYLSMDEAKSIPHIPATVLSYEQATFILQSLGGKKAPDAWQGGLSLTNGAYFVGDDGKTEVNLDLEMDNKIGPIWDVIGTIDGSIEPDQQVLIGNHRDAWVCGAVDPSSGSSALMEIARGFGALLKQGWRPRRTIKLASWDGEEYALLGSTEYAEDHKESLLKHAVAYINVDLSVGPLVTAGGTPSISSFLLETAKRVPGNAFNGTPTDLSLFEQWDLQFQPLRGQFSAALNASFLAPDHMVMLLGSGTDYTAFYQHLGIASANLAFVQAQAMYGTYHSTMDSLGYVEHFADPHYATQRCTAQWWGLLAMRLATNPILPLDFSTYALVMQTDLGQFEQQTKALGLQVDYTELYDAISEFATQAEAFQVALNEFVQSYSATDSDDRSDGDDATPWNHKLMRLERQFIAEEGLPHRPWYRHVIFGPGFYEGYAGTAFPGIADAIAFKDDTTTTQRHVDDVARVVQAAAAYFLS